MTFTYDLASDIGRVRRTVPDKDSTDFVWTDEEIQSFIDDEGDWRRASASILETAASDDLLVLKLIRINNVEVTGVDRAASVLLKRAQQLRELANQFDDDSVSDFDIIEVVWDDFSLRQRISNEGLRKSI